MKKRLAAIWLTAFALMITGCGNSGSAKEPDEAAGQITENADQVDTEEDIATEGVADYPAAIMVNDTVYLLEGVPMSAEVDESAIIGYTESYTDTFPENNGETNFNREPGMPYAQVEGGIAVLYENEWYLATPASNMADENTITFTGTLISIVGWKAENVTKGEGIYVYNEESQISEIALSFSLKNISPTGATLVFDQYDADAPKGELTYGEDYVIEVLKDDKWEETLITVEGDYGFHDISYNLPCEELSDVEINWEWLYGELTPGEYRIGKSVIDSIESGNFDKYMVYAHFVLKSPEEELVWFIGPNKNIDFEYAYGEYDYVFYLESISLSSDGQPGQIYINPVEFVWNWETQRWLDLGNSEDEGPYCDVRDEDPDDTLILPLKQTTEFHFYNGMDDSTLYGLSDRYKGRECITTDPEVFLLYIHQQFTDDAEAYPFFLLLDQEGAVQYIIDAGLV